jgi:hypothetical protein
MLEEMLGETLEGALAMFPDSPACQKLMVDACRLHPTYAGQRRFAFRLIPATKRARENFLQVVVAGLEGRQDEFAAKMMASDLDPERVARACYVWAMGRRSKLAVAVEGSKGWGRVRAATGLGDDILEHLFVWLPMELPFVIQRPTDHVHENDAGTLRSLTELNSILEAVQRNPDVLTTAPDPTLWIGLLRGAGATPLICRRPRVRNALSAVTFHFCRGRALRRDSVDTQGLLHI